MNKKILLCGLPASGKTTLLAALWHLLSQKDIPTALSLASLPQQRDYLSELSRKWSRFIPFGRTSDEVHEISMRLTDETIDIDFHVPDMSGETWEAIWSTRFCSEAAAKWANAASGILLCIHVDKIRTPVDIMTCNAMANSAGRTRTETEPTIWSPDSSPTQVILVDVLQVLARPPLGNSGRRLAIILSAWDKAEAMNLSPEGYFQVHLPLLHQFLSYCNDFSEINIYGVSALGGDLESEEDAKRVKAEDVPSRRIKVVEDGKTHHDLTVPMKWLMTS